MGLARTECVREGRWGSGEVGDVREGRSERGEV